MPRYPATASASRGFDTRGGRPVPRYDFKCSDGHVTEHTLPAPPPAETACACGQTARRVFTAPRVPVLDEFDRKYRMRRRPNPGDDLPRPSSDGSKIIPPGTPTQDGKRRRPLREQRRYVPLDQRK